MSTAAKLTFGTCCLVSVSIIGYVHYKQQYDRYYMFFLYIFSWLEVMCMGFIFLENNFTRVYCEISSDNSAEKLKISIIFNDKLIWLESTENTLKTKAILNVRFFSNFNCISFIEIKRMNRCILVNVHFHSSSRFHFQCYF